MVTYLPNSMLRALRLDDYEAEADRQQLAFNPAPPEPAPEPPKPAFSLPSWDQIAFGAGQLAQNMTSAVQGAGEAVQEAAGAFKLPAWDDFKLGAGKAAEQVKQTAASAMPSWTEIAFPDAEGTVGPGSHAPGQQTAGAGSPSPSAPAVGNVDTSSRAGFISTAMPYAQQTEARYGIPAAFTMALAVNEHGGESRYMPGDNNFFGIQGDPSNSTPYKDWRPGPNGEQLFYDAWARNFSSPQEGFDYFGSLLANNPRYSGALDYYKQTGDLSGFTQRIQQGGYAEDPQWVSKIVALASEMPTGGAVAGPAAPARVENPSDRYDIAFGYDQEYGGAQFNPDIPRHRGVDLVVRGAENGGRGSPVGAFQGGTVVALTQDPNGGNGVIIQDADGLYHRYFHFDSVSVRQGQQVAPGETIGTLGASGTEGFPHVHFEVSRGMNGDPVGQTIDPRPYMAGQPEHDHSTHNEPLLMASGDETPPSTFTSVTERQPASNPASTLASIPDKGIGLPAVQAMEPSGDSERGPFDPPGYGPTTPGTLDPTGTGPQPGDFPETPPESPTFYPGSEPVLGPPEPPLYGPAAPLDTRGLPGQISDFAGRVARGEVGNEIRSGVGNLLGDINKRSTPTGPEAERRKKLREAMEASALPEVAKIALRGMDTVGEAILYLEKLLGPAVPEAIREVVKPVLAAVGAEHHTNVPGIGEFGTADLVVNALPIVGNMGGAAQARRVNGALEGFGITEIPGRYARHVGLDEFVGEPVRRAGEFLGGLRDASQELLQGRTGGAPVASVVRSGDELSPASRQGAEAGLSVSRSEPIRSADGSYIAPFERSPGQWSYATGLNSQEAARDFELLRTQVSGASLRALIDTANLVDSVDSRRLIGYARAYGRPLPPRVRDAYSRVDFNGPTDAELFPDTTPGSTFSYPPIRRQQPPVSDQTSSIDLDLDAAREAGMFPGGHGSAAADSWNRSGEPDWTSYGRPRGVVHETPPDPALAAEADRLDSGRQAGRAPGLGVVAQESDRYYHGTGVAFDTPDPATFVEGSLYGPGYYTTSEPRIAGAYAEADRGLPGLPTLESALRRAQQGRRWVVQSGADEEVARIDARIARLQQLIGEVTGEIPTGPNIRSMDVPRNLRLFDIETPVDDATLAVLVEAMPTPALAAALQRKVAPGSLGNDVYDAMADVLGQKLGDVNATLARSGYDGLAYAGGKREPALDDAGNPIRHQVKVIFPESLPKITNATSGRSGGLLPTAAPIAQRLAGQAAGGAVAGGYAASQEEGATPESVARGALAGAAGGALRGAIGTRGGTQALASNVVRATDLSDPHNQNLGQMFERPVPTPATTTPWYRRLAQTFTDDRALLYGWEKDVRARLGANAPAMDLIGDLTRINPDSVAAQRLRTIEDAASEVRDAGVDPSVLSVYMANVHDVDIAQEFGQRAYDSAIARGANPAQAQQAFDRAANGRTFSGNRHVTDIQTQLQSMANDLGPQRMQAVHDAAQRIWDLNTETRDRLFAAGGMDQATHAHLSQAYPHYVTTDIVHHIDPESAVGGGAGRSVSQRTNAIRELSAAGTASDRLDPMQSVVANTVRSERWIAKNTVFNAFHELVNADPALASQLGVTPDKPGGTKEVSGLVNGQRETLRVARPIAEVIEMGNTTALGMMGEVLQAITGPFKAALTTYNPAFQYVTNPLRDAGDFFTRQSAYLGGPQHLGEVVAEYARAIPDVFSGIRSGEYTGPATSAYRRAGGTYERLDTSTKGLARITKDLTASGGEQIKDPRRLASIARDILTLGARPMGERIEQIPRVAAFRMAQRRGATPTQAMIAGHNATIPFEVGGRVTRAFNTAIPFLNAVTQASAQFGRSFRDHPVATTASMATIVGIPALAAQGWNRSDEERQKVYDDIPDYLKRSGLIFVLPMAGQDNRGPLPNYVWLPLGNYAPAATAVNAAAERVMGDANPDDFGKLLAGVLTAYSPIKGESIGSVASSVVPPGVSTAIELGQNKDFFRGRTIATDESDLRAGSLAKGITGALNAGGSSGLPLTGGLRDVRPSQTEYVVRDLFGSPGQTASAAVDLATGRDDGRTRPIQDIPVVGGLAGRVVRDTGGQKMEDARDAQITPTVETALRGAGLRPEDVVQPVGITAQGVPLTREQQLAYQTFMNGYLQREITAAQRTAEYRNPATREQAIRDAVSAARTAAAERVLARIPSSQQELLKRREADRKAS